MERGNDPPRARAKWLQALMPSCREVTALSSMASDHSLPWWRRPGYWIHLAFCRWCRRYRRQLRYLGAALRLSTNRSRVRHPLPPKARNRIKRALRDDPAGSDDCDCHTTRREPPSLP
jgi:hypothetical protein